MKQFSIVFNDINSEDFEFLENTSFGMDVIDRGQFYMNDVSTGSRILAGNDEISFYATDIQEALLVLKFGDKIHRLV